MAEKRTTYKIQDLGGIGRVYVTAEAFTVIAALAATEIDGVASVAGNATNELVSKLGMKNLSKGVRVQIEGHTAQIDLHLNVRYGASIPGTSRRVQEKVQSAIENMTGLQVSNVNVHIAGIEMEQNQ